MSKTVIYQNQDLTHAILAAAIEVHKHLGPGLLESVYQFCLHSELEERGLKSRQEVTVPVMYKSKKLDCGFRADFLIEDQIVLELKSVETLLPIHESQLITYLRLMNKRIGLLINFNVRMLKNGIRRCAL
jgi:GxxExxY protein